MSVFTAIADFIRNLFSSVEKEYERLDPVIRADIETGIRFVNVVETNLEKPASDVLQLAEQVIGSFAVEKVTGMLHEVGIDLNVISEAAGQTDALQALGIILDNLKSKSGQSLKDALFSFAKSIANKLTGSQLPNRTANILVQVAFNKLFPLTA